MRIKTNRKAGFTLVEIMIVVAIIGLLAAIAIPNFVKARATAQRNACINNLRQIDGAKEQHALEARLTAGATIAANDPLINAYLKGNSTPSCPGGGAYTYQNIGTDPSCNKSAAPDNHFLTAPAAPAPAPAP